ncbi:MAG: hypothetical protein JJT89_13495 [Nitriliruptoraceae bacterium]|nr:hypothetical protein [Nitriliruptoraceae bacterium]
MPNYPQPAAYLEALCVERDGYLAVGDRRRADEVDEQIAKVCAHVEGLEPLPRGQAARIRRERAAGPTRRLLRPWSR